MSLRTSGLVAAVAVASSLLSPSGVVAEPAENISDRFKGTSITPESLPERPGAATGLACWELQELDEGRFVCDGYTFEFGSDGSVLILAPPTVSTKKDHLQRKADVTE
ncbi:hypothetical protein [Acaryochloris thomasi]|uniref:hypothetical protein n=1 Tax=Acaryochloris thomasi TaxID=2929456 RepID=UPI000DA6425B|nr:hypothetical protein [Acaryochloris thomasi]